MVVGRQGRREKENNARDGLQLAICFYASTNSRRTRNNYWMRSNSGGQVSGPGRVSKTPVSTGWLEPGAARLTAAIS